VWPGRALDRKPIWSYWIEKDANRRINSCDRIPSRPTAALQIHACDPGHGQLSGTTPTESGLFEGNVIVPFYFRSIAQTKRIAVMYAVAVLIAWKVFPCCAKMMSGCLENPHCPNTSVQSLISPRRSFDLPETWYYSPQSNHRWHDRL
jgi:hypothetical protein